MKKTLFILFLATLTLGVLSCQDIFEEDFSPSNLDKIMTETGTCTKTNHFGHKPNKPNKPHTGTLTGTCTATETGTATCTGNGGKPNGKPGGGHGHGGGHGPK